MIIKETQYLIFKEQETKLKTKIIFVMNINHDEIIAHIRWYNSWRQYCFFPKSDTVWNTKCLDDVNDLIKKLMKDRRINKLASNGK